MSTLSIFCLVAVCLAASSVNVSAFYFCSTPRTYDVPRTFTDDERFWTRVNNKLQYEHCGNLIATVHRPCNYYMAFNFFYRKIVSNLKRSCQYHWKSLSWRKLRQIVRKFCKSSANSNNHFGCSSNCGLIDHLRQICEKLEEPIPTTTEAPTTTTELVCGDLVDCSRPITIQAVGLPGDTGIFQTSLYPCPYPRDQTACTFVVIADRSFFVTLEFLDFDVPCDDMVEVSNDDDEPIIATGCNGNGGIATGVVYGDEAPSSILGILLTLDGATSGRGFRARWTLNAP